MVRYITEIPSAGSGGILNNGTWHNYMDFFVCFVSGKVHDSCWGRTFIFNVKCIIVATGLANAVYIKKSLVDPNVRTQVVSFPFWGWEGEWRVADECLVQYPIFRKAAITCCC